MENARYIVKVVAIPLVFACLIPVFYRAGVSFLSADSASVTKTLKGIEKRLMKLEQETTASIKRANEIAKGYQSLSGKLEQIELILHQANVDRLEKDEHIEKNPDKQTLHTVDKYADTGWAIPIGLSVLQILFILVNIALCVKIKRLGRTDERSMQPSAASNEQAANKNKKA